jgi:transposase-like protein
MATTYLTNKTSVVVSDMETWPETLQEAIQYFIDADNCERFMVAIRWAEGKVRCPQCDSEKVTYLAKQRRWKCYGKHPKAQFSLKVGTIFEDSPLGLDKWLPAAWLICNCKNGISSYELSRGVYVQPSSGSQERIGTETRTEHKRNAKKKK